MRAKPKSETCKQDLLGMGDAEPEAAKVKPNFSGRVVYAKECKMGCGQHQQKTLHSTVCRDCDIHIRRMKKRKWSQLSDYDRVRIANASKAPKQR